MTSETHPEIECQDIPLVRPDPNAPVLAWARYYAALGFAPIPLVSGEKKPRRRDWTKPLEEGEYGPAFAGEVNIGLLLGPPSGGLVVVDLDSPTAVVLADSFLPPTGMVDGRPAKPRSHRFYRCDGAIPGVTGFDSPKAGRKHVEVLADRHQAVVPPSRFKDGEGRAWALEGQPATVESEALLRAVTLLAVACELSLIWPASGSRHAAALALAGGLIRAGWDEAEVGLLLDDLWTTAEEREVANVVAATAAELADEEERITGWPTFAAITGATESVRAICDWLGVGRADRDDERPSVQVTQGNLDRMRAKAWRALESVNDPPALFRRSNRPVRVERIDGSDTVVVRELNADRLRHHAAKAIRWYTFQKEMPVPAKPPEDVIRDMLATPDLPLPVLERVVTVPVFAPDGTLQTDAGYHAAAKVFHEPPAGLTIPPIPERPTPGEIAAARALIFDDLLADFPFAGEADRAHALALALLPFVRDMIEGPTPLHLFEAAKAGTGKGLLVRALTTISTGGSGAAETPLPGQEEEVRKKLLSVLMEGRPFVLFDNLNERVDSSSLAAVLTSVIYQDRKLGVSETAYIPVRCGWAATGNNVVMTTEIARRTVRCRLVAEVERPHLRTDFKHPNLIRHLRSERGAYLGAVLTLVRAWVVAGRPEGRSTLGSFESWAAVIGGILDVAGVPGFLANAEDFYAATDDEGGAWREFVRAWWDQHGPERATGRELVDPATAAGIPFNATDRDKRAAELGKLLRGQIDSIYAGFAIRRAKAPRGASNAYRLDPKEGQTWDESQRPTPGMGINGHAAGGGLDVATVLGLPTVPGRG